MSPKAKANPLGKVESPLHADLLEAPESSSVPRTKSRQRRKRSTAVASAEASQASAIAGPPTPARPRRAVFIDVENTTAETALSQILLALALDPAKQELELTAVGNWRTVPPAVARRLASVGARLIHSAPARGVRDWSDLWIATAAGCWLGQARPGDVLEIVSNDRAFDAIGDLAAARGVLFRRVSHTAAGLGGATKETQEAPARGSTGRGHGQSQCFPNATSDHQVSTPGAVAQAATAEQIVATIARLTGGDPTRWVNLDVLERALKDQGFVRPPGSPRLVTRLRALRQVEVDAHGRARLRPQGAGGSPPEVARGGA